MTLDGCIVIDVTSGLAGAYCTKLLADGGATVVKVEPPGGDPLRRWSETGAVIPSGEDSALFRYLSTSKQSVVAGTAVAADIALARVLVARADVVVWSAGSPIADDPEFSPSALHSRAPGAVVVALSPFGLDGPWKRRPSTEFTLQALCGGHVQRGTRDRPPLMCGGRPGEWTAGTYAAIGALASLRRAAAAGVGDLIDVAVLDSLMFSQPMYPVTYASVTGRPYRPFRASQLPNLHPTQDGYVSLQVASGQQWLDFCAMIGREDWLEDARLARMDYRSIHRDEIVPVIDAWTQARTTAEIVELATLLRVPVAEVGNGENLPHFGHFVERAFFTTNPAGFVQPAVPYRMNAAGVVGGDAPPMTRAPYLGEHTEQWRAAGPGVRHAVAPAAGEVPLPLAGVRVVDLTAYWAGPIIGFALAALGAEVIHIESSTRPDGLRMSGVRPMTDPQWWEWCPLFHGTNTNKLDLAIDLDTVRGREILLELIDRSDVVIDNFSPRVLEQWGMGQDELLARCPGLVVLRAPAYGIAGPWRERLAYAPTIEAQSGLAWITGFPDGPPEPPSGLADVIGGAHATLALLLALEHRRRTGSGAFVECPMVGASLSIGAEQVVEYSAYGNLITRHGNRSRWCVPQGVYRTADLDAEARRDCWVAISVSSDDQWRALCSVIDRPGWDDDAGLATLAGRRAVEERIDEALGEWCATRAADAIVASLSSAGVPAEPVVAAHEHHQLEQIVWRGLFDDVEHPLTGTHPHIGLPFRSAAGPIVHNRRHAPLLGEHNRDVLARVLGLGAEEIDALERDGVLGTTVSGGMLH